jgi:hypothetical protein
MPKTFSYGDTAPMPKDVKDTRMLEPGGRETRGQKENNNLKRQVTPNKTPKSGGATGHP